MKKVTIRQIKIKSDKSNKQIYTEKQILEYLNEDYPKWKIMGI